MKSKILSVILLLGFISFTYAQTNLSNIVVSKDLEIIPLSENVFIHVSVMETETFGKVHANGLIYISGKEAVVMDTPPSDALAEKLLNWFAETYPDVQIKTVVATHFHADCLGGFKAFHEKGISSYAHQLTPELIKGEGVTLPQHTFKKRVKLKVGEDEVVCGYFGEGHTRDNIVVWVPEEKVLFGGCMIKSMKAGKGNLEDANVREWPSTVQRVKEKYPAVATVVPGHGNHGGIELLDYTIALFSEGNSGN